MRSGDTTPMRPFYSREFHDLARPHLGWVLEQYNLFDELVPDGDVQTDFAAGTVRRGGYELGTGLLGSYAEDGTWLWGWANPHFEGSPAIAEAERLRDLVAGAGAPEFTEGLVDLNHLPDPRLGSDHLALAAMGVLGARGLVIFNHAGRARTFLVVTDPAVPYARPGARTQEFLRTGSLLFGDPAWDGEGGYATVVVLGYLAHHGLTENVGAGEIRGVFDNGNVLTARIGENDTLDGVEVTGPDGGEPLPGPGAAPIGLRRTGAGQQLEPFPAGLLPTVLPRLAHALAQDPALGDHLSEAGWTTQEGPAWDADTATLSYETEADAPGPVVVAGREIGVLDPAAATWEWSDWEGADLLRAAARDGGHPEFAADVVDLSGHRRPGNVVDILTRTAADLGSGRGVVALPVEGGRTRYVAVTDPAVPAAGADLGRVSDVILSAANLLHPVAPREHLRRGMRALARGYFEAFGLPTLNIYGPEALGGLFGLYEARVLFSGDGTIQSVDIGLMGAPR
ncbi:MULTISPECIES: DUF6882 domain-containing protein [unclassified Nocardiopsis]|uniref:DUF6882 domain-containing protein n=1 Tax=Nocardiopsis TaxID=2013 RepID=UPI00387B888A